MRNKVYSANVDRKCRMKPEGGGIPKILECLDSVLVMSHICRGFFHSKHVGNVAM